MMKWIFPFICLTLVTAGGCDGPKSGTEQPNDSSKIGQKRLQLDRKNKIPKQVLNMVHEHPEQEKTTIVEVNGEFWVIVTWGEQRTGGYHVKITDAFLETTENETSLLTVYVRYNKPEPGSMLTQALTYPNDVVLIKGFTKKPDDVSFVRLNN